MTRHVVVLVLENLGRSPRMQYHALSFANASSLSDSKPKVKVSLIGYAGENVIEPVRSHPSIKVLRLSVWDLPSLRFILILHAVMKGICLFLSVFLQLAVLSRYHLIVIQNPPCLPALMAAILVSVVNRSKIMIDWHNLGFAMFEERLKSSHPLVINAPHMCEQGHEALARCELQGKCASII